MDKALRKTRQEILKVFAKEKSGFALTGGTALELYYLHHRFSADLDFFSTRYDEREIDNLIAVFKKKTKSLLKLEAEFIASDRAKVKFYTIPVEGSEQVLKIDFVEDVIFKKPKIENFDGVQVYSIDNIYFQKICCIAGTHTAEDEIGRKLFIGRRSKARDAFDLYVLSKKVKPLHIFLAAQSNQVRRGVVNWYRTFSRQELKLELLDLDIYGKNFNAREIVAYLENEVKEFIQEVIEE